MKATLIPGIAGKKTLQVDEGRCNAFMGPENAVYATPMMVSDVEYAIRDFLLGYLDPGEDTVGTHVTIDHLAATPRGMRVTIEYAESGYPTGSCSSTTWPCGRPGSSYTGDSSPARSASSCAHTATP